jgi:hypothetical protein
MGVRVSSAQILKVATGATTASVGVGALVGSTTATVFVGATTTFVGSAVATGACVVAVAHADNTMAAIIKTVSKLQYFLIIFSPLCNSVILLSKYLLFLKSIDDWRFIY